MHYWPASSSFISVSSVLTKSRGCNDKNRTGFILYVLLIFVGITGYGEGYKSQGKTSGGIHLSKTGCFIFFYDAAPLWNNMCAKATGWISMKQTLLNVNRTKL